MVAHALRAAAAYSVMKQYVLLNGCTKNITPCPPRPEGIRKKPGAPPSGSQLRQSPGGWRKRANAAVENARDEEQCSEVQV